VVKGNKGANRLARVMMMAADHRIKKKVFHAVLGTVRSDMSLLLDDFPDPVPEGDWLKTVVVQSGDRVVCLPVNHGDDYVVIGRLI